MPASYSSKRAGIVDTTVELKGVKQKVGVFDGDSNSQLGDMPKSQTYQRRRDESWYFRPGDYFPHGCGRSGVSERHV